MPWIVKHGRTGTKEYGAWQEMKRRCLNTRSKDFQRYGARGITVDPILATSFETFYREVGDAPTTEHSLDRIDSSKGYIPGNLRWATPKEQAHNRRTSYVVTIDGVQFNGFSEAARHFGISKVMMRNRCMGTYDKRINHFTPPWKGYSYELRYN